MSIARGVEKVPRRGPNGMCVPLLTMAAYCPPGQGWHASHALSSGNISIRETAMEQSVWARAFLLIDSWRHEDLAVFRLVRLF